VSVGRDLDLSCSTLLLSINVIVIIFTVKNVEYVCERMVYML